MKNVILLAIGFLTTFNSHAFSICRNATNTVIYETAQNFKELQAAKVIDGKAVLQKINLDKHEIKLFERFLLDSTVMGNEVITTSSVKIQVTKNDGSAFSTDFLNLTEDNMAIFTTYICETTEIISETFED